MFSPFAFFFQKKFFFEFLLIFCLVEMGTCLSKGKNTKKPDTKGGKVDEPAKAGQPTKGNDAVAGDKMICKLLVRLGVSSRVHVIFGVEGRI